MESRERTTNRRSRLWAIALAAALACALMTGTAAAAPVTGALVIPDVAASKPTVTIQGNVVVDKNKPTGFYELALCVKTARDIYLKGTTTPVLEEIYEQDIAQNPDNADLYDVVNYPFQSAAVTVHIDLDSLTAVTWETGKPTYKGWTAQGATGTSGQYDDCNADYPRGIDMSADENKTDTNFVTLTDSIKDLIGGTKTMVRLYTANPDEITNATALIEGYDATNNSALLTLSANTTTNTNVIYENSTPVVVVRFAYDLNRMKNTTVPLVGEPNQSDFWVGANRNMQNGPDTLGKRPLTYLGASDPSGGYATSDTEAAMASIHQTVWYTQNLINNNVGQSSTDFYYYLGAETPSHLANTQEIRVRQNGTTTTHQLAVPNTAGNMVLANRLDDDPPGLTIGLNQEYSFFQNLLSLEGERTLRMTLVNAETYRKPTGGIGGAQILFYDWNDDLIGALVVDPEGDARAAVNEYVERVMIHEDLHTENILASATDYDDLQTKVDYQDYLDRVNLLDREFTYRGEYAYTVGGNDEIGENGDSVHQGRADGANYPLTNKLDYAFYRRVTKQIEETDADGVVTRYFVTNLVSEGDGSEDYDGYLYPYVYGWAIVEDENQDLTKDNWILHKDSVKTQDIWTTFGVGELANLKPGGGAAGQVTDPDTGLPVDYTYAVSSKDAASYLKFADFSAMEKLLREGQDVVIVKAVYEPGKSLLVDYNYTVVEDSLYIERYSYAASTEASVYSFQYQYRRASQAYGVWQGVNRTREPAVQTGYTYDVNAFDDAEKEVDLDPAVDTSVFFLKTIANNDDILNIDLTTGGVLWKVEYFLVDTYDENISTGVQRSAGEELNLKNNFLYDDVEYPDRQGTDGFIMQATLNTLLAEANKGARGEANKLSRHMGRPTLTDMNWRADMEGTQFTIGNYSRVSTYFQDLVTRLYKAGVSIDPKTGDVKLGWHQIQRHILMCTQAGSAVDGIFSGGVLMSEEACAGFPWCRLDDCGLIVTVDIFDLGDIFVALDKAKTETGDKHPAQDALDKLMTDTPSLLDGYLNQFRKDEDGRKFKDRDEMMDALEGVYDILSGAGLTQDQMKAITPDQVQEIIITGRYPTTGKTYWWKDGGQRPITTWKDFIEAGMLVVSGDVPDALDAMTNDKLPNAVQNMISYAAPTGSPANVGWFRYKDSQEDDNAYTDVEAFKEDWLKTLKVLTEKGGYDLPKDWDTIPWEEIQYALIHKDYKDVTNILRSEDYWWKDGGLPKLTYEKLLAAANEYRKSGYTDSSELDRLLAKGINPVNNEVYLRRTVAGSGYNDVASFKTALRTALSVIDYTSNSSLFVNPITGDVVVDIYQMQYLLLNYNRLVGKELPTTQEIQDTAGYWWIPEPHLPTSAQRVNDIMDLLMYAFWQRDGVNETQPEDLGFEPLGMLDAATMERLRLRAEEHGMPYTDETNATLVSKVLDMLNTLPYSIENFANQSAADLTREVQYALFHGTYLPASSIKENYWWQGSGFEAETHETLAQAAWLASVGFDGKTAPDATNNIYDLDFITRRDTIDAFGMAMRSNMNGAAFISLDIFKETLTDMVKAAADKGMTYDDLTGMTNYQLQYLLINGVYKSDADVKAEVIVDGVDAYWWFTADKPPEPDVKREPIIIDQTEWDSFLDSAIGYYSRSTGNKGKFTYELTDEKLKDVLRLRKGPKDEDVITAEEMFKGDKTDLLWRVMTVLHTLNRDPKFITGTNLSRKWNEKPTWEEFQYVLINLGKTETNLSIPDTETCEKAKDDYDWMWITLGRVEYERIRVDEAEWDSFLDSAIGYYSRSTGNKSKFTYELTDEKIKDTLLLRKEGGEEIKAAELFKGDKTDLLWRVMTVLHTLNRDPKFITGTNLSRKWNEKPTWEEFQYVLLNLGKTETNLSIPDAETCEAWLTQDNAPWVWPEKGAGASLFAAPIEIKEPEDEPVVEPNWVDEDEVAPERPDESPGGSRRWIYNEVPEVPVEDEGFPMTDPQGGF